MSVSKSITAVGLLIAIISLSTWYLFTADPERLIVRKYSMWGISNEISLNLDRSDIVEVVIESALFPGAGRPTRYFNLEFELASGKTVPLPRGILSSPELDDLEKSKMAILLALNGEDFLRILSFPNSPFVWVGGLFVLIGYFELWERFRGE